MKKLILVGASDWSVEVYSWLRDALGYGAEWEFKGFLDDNSFALAGKTFCQHKIIGDTRSYQPAADDVFVCAIGNPSTKAKVVERLLAKEAEFITLIHKSVIFYDDIKIGAGCILAPNVVVSCQVVIHDHVGINIGCAIGHNVEIGSYTQLSSHIDLTGFVKLGEKVFIGSSACFIPKVTVGDNAVVGAGSVVLRKVKAGTTVFGNPAKIVMP
jgi:sugar O-acyltransferase (sialic acid O-acetyltransferase NeuD family)